VDFPLASPLVSDPRNPRVKEARRLARRAFRERSGRFLVEGPQSVREAAAAPDRLLELFATAEAGTRHPEILVAAAAGGARVMRASDEVVAALAETVTPQGLVGVSRLVTVGLDDVIAVRPRLVSVLAQARDPGNVGTVIRASDAAGAEAVILSEESVDVHNGKCVRASAGSLFHLPITADVPMTEALPALRAQGLTLLAADGAGDVDLDAATDTGLLSRPVAWVFGNEARGLPEDVIGLVDEVVRVPLYGQAESLNLAAAAAVCLYATARAQRQPGGCRR